MEQAAGTRKALSTVLRTLARGSPAAMSDQRSMRETAENNFRKALVARGVADPRDRYRSWIRELKQADPSAYRKAVEYYEDTLIPAVASVDSDPWGEWLEYGRLVLSLLVAGRTVMVDETGLANPYERPVAESSLVLHIPTSARQNVEAISIPPHPSPAQAATHDLLVLRRAG